MSDQELRNRIEDVLLEFSLDALSYDEAVDRLLEIFGQQAGIE